jgi:hypothetical protein
MGRTRRPRPIQALASPQQMLRYICQRRELRREGRCLYRQDKAIHRTAKGCPERGRQADQGLFLRARLFRHPLHHSDQRLGLVGMTLRTDRANHCQRHLALLLSRNFWKTDSRPISRELISRERMQIRNLSLRITDTPMFRYRRFRTRPLDN